MSYNNPKITYKKEIEVEYRNLREKINNGKRLPYRDYIRERARIYVDQLATYEELKDLQKRIELALIVFPEPHDQTTNHTR